MRKTNENPAKTMVEAALGWVVPASIQVQRFAEIMCSDPNQVITRPLLEGVEVPGDTEIIYFSSQEYDVPAFVDESAFEQYCEDHGYHDEIASDGKFSAVTYHMTGRTFAGEDTFIGSYGSAERAEQIRAALAEPVQALIDAGLLVEPQPLTAEPEL